MVTLALTGTQENGTKSYDILANSIVIGFCQLRPTPTKSAEIPTGFENHIYYEISPEHRGKSYVTAALKLLLEEARNLRLKEVILTVDVDNPASQRVVIKNGGVLLDTQKGQSGLQHHKYSIVLC